MLPRTLGPIMLCTALTWPLRALACMNSMDTSSIVTPQTVWLDLSLWTVGAVFLNRVVLVNVRGPAAEGQPPPSWFRRSFFGLVGVCLVLVLAAVSAGGPLLNLSAHNLTKCLTNRPMLLVLMASPAVVFVLQTVLFQRLGKWLFGGDGTVAIVSLVISSAALAVAVDLARGSLVLPLLCGHGLGSVFASGEY